MATVFKLTGPFGKFDPDDLRTPLTIKKAVKLDEATKGSKPIVIYADTKNQGVMITVYPDFAPTKKGCGANIDLFRTEVQENNPLLKMAADSVGMVPAALVKIIRQHMP